jgi:hypothetical protein
MALLARLCCPLTVTRLPVFQQYVFLLPDVKLGG